MAIILTPNGKTPGQTQFGLDTFTLHYTCQNDDGSQVSADDVLMDAGVPQMGSVHPDYSGMFVTARHCDETGEKASALDLVYTGSLAGTGTLPAQKHDQESSVQSASSQMSSTGVQVDSPITFQFYAPTTTLSYISFGAPGSDVVDDPDGDPVVITYTVGVYNFEFGSGIPDIITAFFSTEIIESSQATEIVAGQYWSNTSKKLKTLVPYAFVLPSGAIVQLAAVGAGYAIGDTLTISGGGGTAVIVLTSVGISNSVRTWTVSSNTCTTAATGIVATGGSGSGAAFNILIIT